MLGQDHHFRMSKCIHPIDLDVDFYFIFRFFSPILKIYEDLNIYETKCLDAYDNIEQFES